MRQNRLLPALIVILAAVGGIVYTILANNEPLLGLDLQGGVSVVLEPTGTTDAQGGEGDASEDAAASEVTDEALELTVELLRSRIDQIGVAEPEISRQGDNIVVGLPGLIEDQEDALNRLRQTAELRFRPVLMFLGGPVGEPFEESDAGDGADTSDGSDSTDGSESSENPDDGEDTDGTDGTESSDSDAGADGAETSDGDDDSQNVDDENVEPGSTGDGDAVEEDSLGLGGRPVAGAAGPVGAAGIGINPTPRAGLELSAAETAETESETGETAGTEAEGGDVGSADADGAPSDTEAETDPEAETETPGADGAGDDDAGEDGTSGDSGGEDDAEVPELTEAEITELLEQSAGAAGNPATECLTLLGELAEKELVVTPEEEDTIDSTVILQEENGARYCLGPAVLSDELLTDPAMTPRLTGEMVETAAVSLSPSQGWTVNLTLIGGTNGIDKFNVISLACFNGNPQVCPSTGSEGRGRLAVVLDHEVVSGPPTINAPTFSRDRIVISGSFTEAEARRLAEALRFGALPLELLAQETRTVSASIGSDVLSSGVVAGLIGLALVAIYLLAYYRLAGLVAISGLLLSGMLLWTIVAWFGSSFGLALTLSGVVGLIVAIGVSADSNIVYFENVKDSYRSGRRIPTAVERAYETAISTIIKADVVSLIAAVLLFLLTVGAVRGFAFYLGLATLLDLVISMMFMRPALAWLARLDIVERNPGLLGLPADGGPDAQSNDQVDRVPAAASSGGAS